MLRSGSSYFKGSEEPEEPVGVDFETTSSDQNLAPTTGCCNCVVVLKILFGILAAGGAIWLALLHMPVTAGAFGICSFLLFASARSRPEPASPSSNSVKSPSHDSQSIRRSPASAKR